MIVFLRDIRYSSPLAVLGRGPGWLTVRLPSDAAPPHEEAIVLEDPSARRYRKLVVAGGRIVGAILLGSASDVATAVRTAINDGLDVTGRLEDLRAGRWEILTQT